MDCTSSSHCSPRKHRDNADIRLVFGSHGLLDPGLILGKQRFDPALLCLLPCALQGCRRRQRLKIEVELLQTAAFEPLKLLEVLLEFWLHEVVEVVAIQTHPGCG